MAKKAPLTSEEVVELFSELDESGVLDPDRKKDRAKRRSLFDRARKNGGDEAVSALVEDGKKSRRARRAAIDPLSEQDPSGSQVGKTISRTGALVIAGVLLFVLGMQVVYGVNRRLNTANLSENVDRFTVEHAMESGVEWGNGFTQFPATFSVDEADERSGVVEVTVVDTDSANELELLSNSQIQAAALATNALLNEKIDRVVYNVCALVNRDGSYAHDRLFGFVPASGTRKTILTFIWTKESSQYSNYIDWKLKIVGMDDSTTGKIQEQVNSVSSLIENDVITQNEVNEERLEMQREHLLHGSEIFRGGPREKSLEDVLTPEEKG